jgi:hypothetical protein
MPADSLRAPHLTHEHHDPLCFDRVLCVGDTHGNSAWWGRFVAPLADHVGADAIVQVGDFGFWPGRWDGDAFLDQVRSSRVPVLFLDGNHEDHPALRAATGYPRRIPCNLGGNLWYLPRGSRLRIAGADAVAVGGARSIDRALRRPGVDWFWEEALDDEDLASLGTERADILLSHDAPAGWAIPGLAPDAALPLAWRGERPACEEHRARLRQALEVVRPELVIHGHYHQSYDLVRDEAWGPMSVAGLSEDGSGLDACVLLSACDEGSVLQRLD